MTQCCSSAPGHQKSQGSPYQPSTAPTAARRRRSKGCLLWLVRPVVELPRVVWPMDRGWGRGASGGFWGNIVGESLEHKGSVATWQPWWFSPCFLREIQRFRTQTWGSNGKLMGKFMGDDGSFGTNTMRYECVWKWRINAPPIDVFFHSEKDDETVDEIGPYCQTNPRCNYMG